MTVTTDARSTRFSTDALDGRVALVTGASRGIGRGIALALAEAGADVAVDYHVRREAAEEVRDRIESLGRRSVAIEADVSSSADVDRMVARVEASLGPVDVLVNNAGIARPSAVEELSEADWDEVLGVNLTGAFLVTQAVLGPMREQGWGRIVNVSSVAAKNGGLVGPHYAASKAGLLGLTRSYARRLAGEGVTCNAVAPALVATDMVVEELGADPDAIPVGRFGRVEEVADVVLTLVRNGYITGETVDVAGGLSLG